MQNEMASNVKEWKATHHIQNLEMKSNGDKLTNSAPRQSGKDMLI